MTTYTLQRPGEVDLQFDGLLLCDESSQDDPKRHPDPAMRFDPTRWTEIRIYALNSRNGWVVEYVGKSSRSGETDRPRVLVCPTPDAVKEALRRKGPGSGTYLTNVALDALSEAADRDPRLRAVTVEKL